jgi:UPF0755 protein
MNPLLRIALALLVGLGLIAVFSAVKINAFLDTPLTIEGEQLILDVRPGTSFAALSQGLYERGALKHPNWFRWYGRLTGKASRVKAGEYQISAGTTIREFLDELLKGQVYLHSLTIIEGWKFVDLLAALRDHPAVEHTLQNEDWQPIANALGATEGHPEGLFLPETYRFPKGTSDMELLRQAYRQLQEVLATEWAARSAPPVLQDPYQAIILASIIEKETARADERARISGVFTRRLQKGMRLQTDPTVIYGIGPDFDGNLTRRDLRNDTPYNTYRRAGLPPTPIALAGRAAIHAALNPADGAELFFVATGLGDGSHQFSVTQEEHEQAVKDYLQRLRNRQTTAQP